MSKLQAKRKREKHPDDDTPFGMNLTPWLLEGETVASVGSVTSEPGLTVEDGRVNDEEFVDDDEETCAVDYGVVYDCSGGSAGSDYLVTVQFTTSSGRVLNAVQIVSVRDR